MNHSINIVELKKSNAVSPTIISVSRSTDIPAFYSEWFMNRLRSGHIRWKNPFNQKSTIVDLSNVAGAVFWSKNPRPMLPYLDEISKRGIDFYFQFTINDYAKEQFEPHVPILAERLETFKQLSRLLGKNKVVWRFDPICLSDNLGTADILQKMSSLAGLLHNHTERLVVSFVDVCAYAKVQRNIKRGDKDLLREPTEAEQNELAIGIAGIAKDYGLEASACGEIRSFSAVGIPSAKCIDGKLFAEICSPSNHRLQTHLGINKSQGSLLALQQFIPKMPKDKGQRKECGCIESKDIGMYNTCGHMCVYCYANNSQKTVEKNMRSHSPVDDGIVPT